jgi:5-methylcytosine-specific restriction endonuclease McrA
VELNPIALAKIEACPRPTAEDILRNRTHIARSGRRGGDMRGNAHDRAARTAKLLVEFGDGGTCPCVYCAAPLTAATLTQDKIYTGDQGGRYTYANLLPACMRCNRRRSDATIREFIEEAEDAIAHAATYLS